MPNKNERYSMNLTIIYTWLLGILLLFSYTSDFLAYKVYGPMQFVLNVSGLERVSFIVLTMVFTIIVAIAIPNGVWVQSSNAVAGLGLALMHCKGLCWLVSGRSSTVLHPGNMMR